MNLQKKSRHLLSALLFLGLSTTAISSQAAKVLQVKNTKTLVDLEGDSVSENDEFYLINPETTKKTAIIRIKQIKNGKAIAEVTKGSAAIGYTLQAKAASPRAMSADVKEESATPTSSAAGYTRSLRPSWGIVGHYVMANMNATFSRSTPTSHTAESSMKGTGFGAGLFYNHTFSPVFSLAAEGSLYQFNASGSTPLADCNGSTTCDVKIMYVGGYGMGRYYFNPASNFKTWAGLGAGFLFAMSKSSTVLNTSEISTNQVISGAFGADYQLNRKTYIPFSLQYDSFPSSASVKANSLVLRVGYAWNM